MQTILYRFRTIAMWLVFGFMASGLASCSTYHNVATWYKYRKDFHLPKPVAAPERAVAKAKTSEPGVTTQEVAAAQPSDPRQPGLSPSRKERRQAERLERRTRRAEARQVAMRRRVSKVLEMATASTEGTAYYPILKSWERQLDEPLAPAQVADRPISVPALLGFIFACSTLIIPFFIPFLGLLLFLAALILSIIGMSQAGPNKRFSGKGFALAGLIICIVEAILFLLLLLVIILIFASAN